MWAGSGKRGRGHPGSCFHGRCSLSSRARVDHCRMRPPLQFRRRFGGGGAGRARFRVGSGGTGRGRWRSRHLAFRGGGERVLGGGSRSL